MRANGRPVADDSEIKVVEIPLDDIFSDEHFNCRGFIPPSDVVDLAREIQEQGLLSPIIVQPASDVGGMPPGKGWRIVAGHRRYAAFIFNRDKAGGPATVPAIVKEGLNETQALIINLGENTNRKQLNILQEARAIERLKNAGLNQSDIATALKVPRPWVQVRFYVLDLPADIQEEVGAGYVSQAQIHQLNSLETDEEKYEAVRQIKDAKIKAGTKRLKVKVQGKPKAENLLKAKPRDRAEVAAMLGHMMDTGEVGLHTRCLAWAAGNITTVDLLVDFKSYMSVELGKYYEIPEDGLPGL
jgi:ParB family chromosome partitioning protein